MMRVSVALLGDVVLRVDGEEVPVTRPRLRSLLCALALRAGRVVPFDVLVEQVWGERWPNHPRAGLHTLVNQLRKLLGVDVVRTEPNGYLLDMPADAVDALRFEGLLDRLPDGPPHAVRTRLDEALSLWRDGPVADVEHLDREVAPRLVERYLSAMEQRVDMDLELGKHDELVPELQTLVARHPLRESMWARLMTALHRSGRHAEALATYESLRDHIANTLGVDPSAELRDQHAQLLAADDDQPAHVVPRQLPPDIAGFTGRGADLATLDKVLGANRDGPPLVIAVHGPGGAGKTTLALHWAHRVREDFPDGQLYLNMRGYGPGEPMDPAIALDIALRAMGVPATQVPPGTDERASLWRSTLFGKRLLLLVDNVNDASQVRPLLPGAGSVVLVTSRSELGGLEIRNGARRLNVGELPAGEATELIGEVIGADRAAAEPHAVAELVTLCGRLPLALVIAAQRAARYPDTLIADLVADLRASGSRLDLLGDPDDPAVDPRAVFSWSYHALDADTARAFRYLGLHPTAEINLPAASVLLRTSAEQTRLLLDQLVSVHLLERHQRGWYRFHDLLQVYAVELATAEDPAADLSDARGRILDWYLHTSLRARVRAFTQVTLDVPAPVDEFVRPQEFSDIAAATAWYIRNRETLLATVEYAAEHRFDRHAWQLAFLLRHFHETQRHVNDGTRAAEVALQCAERSAQDTAIAYATHTMGAALTALRQYDDAEQLQLKVLDLGERIGDHALLTIAAVSIGLSHGRSGQGSEAIRWLERGVAVARDSPSRAHALLNLGAVEGMNGLLDRSLAHSAEALALYRELEAPYYQAFVLGNMAEAAWDNGSAADGLAFADEALELLGIIEEQVTLPETLLVRGRILVELGRPADARETWQRALRIFSRNGNPRADSVAELIATLPAGS